MEIGRTCPEMDSVILGWVRLNGNVETLAIGTGKLSWAGKRIVKGSTGRSAPILSGRGFTTLAVALMMSLSEVERIRNQRNETRSENGISCPGGGRPGR